MEGLLSKLTTAKKRLPGIPAVSLFSPVLKTFCAKVPPYAIPKTQQLLTERV